MRNIVLLGVLVLASAVAARDDRESADEPARTHSNVDQRGVDEATRFATLVLRRTSRPMDFAGVDPFQLERRERKGP